MPLASAVGGVTLLLGPLLGLGLGGKRLWRGGQQAAQEVVRALPCYFDWVHITRVHFFLLRAIRLAFHDVSH